MKTILFALLALISISAFSATEYLIQDTVWNRPQSSWRYIYSGSADDFCKYKGHLGGAESYVKDFVTLKQVDQLKIYHKLKNLETILFYIVEEDEYGSYDIGTFGTRKTSSTRVYNSIICKDFL